MLSIRCAKHFMLVTYLSSQETKRWALFYSHFADVEIETKRLSNFSKIVEAGFTLASSAPRHYALNHCSIYTALSFGAVVG